MKTYVKISLFFVAFIAISAILACLYMFNLKSTDMSKAKPDFIITASDLLKAFEADETAASTKYINKIVEVKGIISSVKPAANKAINISLATESDMSSIICTLPAISDPSKYSKGDEIVVRGECSGFLLVDVLMNNCAPIPKK
jgi:hypothetical protein